MLKTPLFALSLSAALAAQQLPSLLYQVPNPTPGQRLLLQQHFDVLGSCCGTAAATTGSLEIVVETAQIGLLLAIAPTAQFQSIGQPLAGLTDIDSQYYTVAEITAEIDALVLAHPTRARKVDLSTLPGGAVTVGGRHIFALKVSDNVAVDEDEPAIVLAAQHHAREVNAPVMVVTAMQRVLNGYATDAQLQALVDGHELYFVPMVNPDGVDYVWNTNNLWRKNRRANGGTSFGVDNNRNYPFLWGNCGSSATTTSETYRGPSAGSEAETITMRNLIATVRPEIYLDFHSYGQDVLRMWAPCATVNPTMQAFQQRYCDDLRTPMGFSTRDPSGSGEAPEDHYASGGALSFLIEVGLAFQPPWADTVAEEAVVWTGVRQALTAWRPALRGHVRSSLGSLPLVSTVTFAPNLLNHGEVTKSRARDGRYGLWLPLGTWNVTFAAAGHQSRTVPITVSSYDTPVDLDVLLEPSNGATTLTKVGTGSVGTNVTFTYVSPGDAGKQAFFGWSFGTAPGIDLGGLRVLPLNNDFLFQNAWIGNPFLAPTWVTLDGSGQAQSVFAIPNLSWVIGITSYVGGITFDPAYQYSIKTWSAPVGVTIIP